MLKLTLHTDCWFPGSSEQQTEHFFYAGEFELDCLREPAVGEVIILDDTRFQVDRVYFYRAGVELSVSLEDDEEVHHLPRTTDPDEVAHWRITTNAVTNDLLQLGFVRTDPWLP